MNYKLACAGSLPPEGDPTRYPFSHIEHWLTKQLNLQYHIVGTGEPGGPKRYGMIERFTQDMDGIEIRSRGGKAKSFCTDTINPTTNPESASEVIEARHLASIVPDGILKKATVTDPVTIGFELIINNQQLVRTYPEIYEDVTEALKPIVAAICDYVDIIQFDCPSHAARLVREPWRYLNDLTKDLTKRTWIHIDGDVSKMFTVLIKQYDADVLNFNLFGGEEEANYQAIAEVKQFLREEGKKFAPAVINTQIDDRYEQVESVDRIQARIRKLSAIMDQEMLEALTPGCGLRLLPKAADSILVRLRTATNVG